MLVVMRLRAGLAFAFVVVVVGGACADAGRERAAAPTTSISRAREPTTTSTVVVSRVMPWISTTVAPNSRDTFAHTLDAAGVHNARPCELRDLFAKAYIGGALGTQYLSVRVQNRSPSPCVVQGSPYLRFLDRRGQNVGELPPQREAHDTPIILTPTSWAIVWQIAVASSACGTNIAAITFGLDRHATRTLPALGTQPTRYGCGPSVGLIEHRAFEPLVGVGGDPADVHGAPRWNGTERASYGAARHDTHKFGDAHELRCEHAGTRVWRYVRISRRRLSAVPAVDRQFRVTSAAAELRYARAADRVGDSRAFRHADRGACRSASRPYHPALAVQRTGRTNPVRASDDPCERLSPERPSNRLDRSILGLCRKACPRRSASVEYRSAAMAEPIRRDQVRERLCDVASLGRHGETRSAPR